MTIKAKHKQIFYSHDYVIAKHKAFFCCHDYIKEKHKAVCIFTNSTMLKQSKKQLNILLSWLY